MHMHAHIRRQVESRTNAHMQQTYARLYTHTSTSVCLYFSCSIQCRLLIKFVHAQVYSNLRVHTPNLSCTYIQMTPQSDSEPLKVYTLSPFALAHALSPPSPLPLAFLLHSFSCSAACARVSLLVVSKFTNLLFRVERAVVILTTQFLLRVLQVHTPFFCTKTIGQSTPYPVIIHTTPCARAPLPTRIHCPFWYVSALDDSQYVIPYVLLHCRVA